jgi:hypothetical protein
MQHAEIEIGAHSPTIMPSDSVSTAVEQIPPENQPHQRVQTVNPVEQAWQESFRPKGRTFGPQNNSSKSFKLCWTMEHATIASSSVGSWATTTKGLPHC